MIHQLKLYIIVLLIMQSALHYLRFLHFGGCSPDSYCAGLTASLSMRGSVDGNITSLCDGADGADHLVIVDSSFSDGSMMYALLVMVPLNCNRGMRTSPSTTV